MPAGGQEIGGDLKSIEGQFMRRVRASCGKGGGGGGEGGRAV